MTTAHRRYATGAIAPSCAAMSAGSRKMPPPIVTLTMPAESASVPIDRTRAESEEGGIVEDGSTVARAAVRPFGLVWRFL